MVLENSEKPVTVSQLNSTLIQFYNTIIEPRFNKIDKELDEVKSDVRETRGQVEDIYKKLEDLRQEYFIANEQMKRLIKSDEQVFEEIAQLKSKMTDLQTQIIALEKRVDSHD